MKRYNKKIIELEFTDNLLNYIDRARFSINISNRARFLKESIHHFVWCVKRREEGWKFAIMKDDEAYEFDIIGR